MYRLSIAIFLTAFSTLMLELLLTRVFDVILTPNMAYMVISCAMFSFGLAGAYLAQRPAPPRRDITAHLSLLSALLAVATLAILPALNLLPFDYKAIPRHPILQLLSFLGMYLALVAPFFLSGLVLATAFSRHPDAIQTLYGWDLTGAAVGCVVMIPLLPPIGPGGLLFCASALALLASALLSQSRAWTWVALAGGLGLMVVPFAHSPKYFEFKEHLAKRGVKEARQQGRIEFGRWDPVSKIDVIDLRRSDGQPGGPKLIAYDGGSQVSHIYPFDGDYPGLRRAIELGTVSVTGHFWHRGVLAAHYVKRDSQQRVLILGSGGGQETKGALMYGAAHVDAVELVRTVVDLGRGRYARYGGAIFNDPRVSVRADEGRAFLRATDAKYDIIQIHSNHTSSSIAAGTGAMAPIYLQTAEAYQEYFTHLTDHGVLHLNHPHYPRMVTTAALAWRQLGRRDFRAHVLVYEHVGIEDVLPTVLVKMSPWTSEEVAALTEFLTRMPEGDAPLALVQDPFHPERSFLSARFFTGDLTMDLIDGMDYRIAPATDDRPFFSFVRKSLRRLRPDAARYVSISTASMMNSQLRGGFVATDVIHLFVTGVVSLFFATVSILVPLRYGEAGRLTWREQRLSLLYFACLGAGFIIIELTFIQVFMKLVGFPVHTYAVVIFTLLFSAGVGSLASRRLGIAPERHWHWPFVGILAYGGLLIFAYPHVFALFLASVDTVRIAVAAALMCPLGFCLGMPFPLGILALERQPRGAIAWAWGLNGLFTVLGGLASVLLALFLGFRETLLFALAAYAIAAAAYSRLRSAAG